jgi:very-short-patch-repair endonuclease
MTTLIRTREYYQEMGRRGGRTRAQMPDFKLHQSNAGKRSAQVNDMAALGAKGAKAFIAKYGYLKFFHLWRNWKLANPSSHEQQVGSILTDLGFTFTREALVLGDDIPLAVDFYLPDCNDRIIEVYGKVHFDPAFNHPNYLTTRAANDAHRLHRLERAGFQVLEIDYRELTNAARVKAKILLFLMS